LAAAGSPRPVAAQVVGLRPETLPEEKEPV
jgi:hypothetical protein